MFLQKYGSAAAERALRSSAALLLAAGLLVPAGTLQAAGTPELSWIRQFGASASSNETARAVDDDGNTYVAGTTDGALSGYTNAGGIDSWMKKYDSHGNLLFAEQFGTAGDDIVTAIAIEQSGIHVIGYTTGTFPGQTSAGGTDIFVRKYAPELDDAHTTMVQFGTEGNDEVLAATNGSTNDYFIAGRTTGAFPSKTNAGGYDAFVGRFDSMDNVYWIDQFGSAADDEANSIDKGTAPEVIAAGTTAGDLPDNTSAGGTDGFFRRIDVDSGNAIATTQFGTSADDEATGVAFLNGELATVAGTTEGAFPDQTNAGGKDAFVKAFAVQPGTPEWTTQFGTSANDEARSIGWALGQRLAFVTGTTAGAFPNQTNAGGTDVFLRKLDTWSGQTLWDTQFGTAFDDTATAVALDDSLKNVFLLGSTLGSLPGQTSEGGKDAFIMKYKQDNDGDGIYNEIDTRPEDFSDDFSDATVHEGVTTGVVVDRSEQNLVVQDNDTDSGGVSLEAKAGGPATPADVSVCQGLAESLLDPGDAIDVLCGSAHIGVKAGDVDTTFIAPDGITTTTHYDEGNTLVFDGTSAFSAPVTNLDSIAVNIGVTQQVIAPGRTVQLMPLAKDSFLREGVPNLNEGANPILLIRKKGDVRSLVAFDLQGLATAHLRKATLVLSIGATPPSNWTSKGNPIEVHRLTQDWSEGNGKDLNVPDADATRGTGPGVTWKCATDSNIQNTEKDCSGNWSGGDNAIAPRTAPAVTIKNGMTGEISFDVTQDVLSGAGYGWLIEKTNEENPGTIAFFSKEGASGAPVLAPKLLLEFDAQ